MKRSSKQKLAHKEKAKIKQVNKEVKKKKKEDELLRFTVNLDIDDFLAKM